MTGLADGYHPVSPGKLASVVTSLEMRARAPARPEPVDLGLTLRRVPAPSAEWYSALYGRMGRDWLWFARLSMSEAALLAIIHDPKVGVFALERDGAEVGLLELDFRKPGEAEIAYFAVASELQGGSAGRWLMNRALEIAWAEPIDRLWVHTCTLDHPAALDFYRRSGFVPFRREIELADDPRLTGALPPGAAPQAPVL